MTSLRRRVEKWIQKLRKGATWFIISLLLPAGLAIMLARLAEWRLGLEPPLVGSERQTTVAFLAGIGGIIGARIKRCPAIVSLIVTIVLYGTYLQLQMNPERLGAHRATAMMLLYTSIFIAVFALLRRIRETSGTGKTSELSGSQ